MASNPDAPREAPPTHRKVSWRSPEILGELVLLAVVAILIAVYFRRLDLCETLLGEFSLLGARACVPIGRFVSVAAGQWLPMIIIGAAIPLWIIRLGYVLRRRKAIEQGMIMDLGFRLGEDPQGERRRAALYFGTLVALILLIWLVGFHIGLPIWVAAYMLLWTRAKWHYALAAALAFEAFIIGILDLALDIFWFEPLLFRWIGVAYPFGEWFTRAF